MARGRRRDQLKARFGLDPAMPRYGDEVGCSGRHRDTSVLRRKSIRGDFGAHGPASQPFANIPSAILAPERACCRPP